MSFNIQTHFELTQVNTLQDTALGIMRWGTSNSFPQTLKNLVEQSPSAKQAVERTATFLKGQYFEGQNEIISTYGLTLRHLVDAVAEDYALFRGFAIHSNYNIKGQIVSMNPFNIPELRFNQLDELNFASKIGFHEDFGRNAVVRKTVSKIATRATINWIDRFNPNAVLAQIKNTKNGISDYKGQILYYNETGHSSYPIPLLQAPINYVLADIENSILLRKETSTGFINSYLMKTTMSSEDPILDALEMAIEAAQGARGSGKIIAMTDMTPEDMKATILEEIGGGAGQAKTIVDSCSAAYELCQKVIAGVYLIPPILAGSDQKTGFSAPDLIDAYFVFNAITQPGRDKIENEVNRLLKASNLNIAPIKLQKLTLDKEEKENEKGANDV